MGLIITKLAFSQDIYPFSYITHVGCVCCFINLRGGRPTVIMSERQFEELSMTVLVTRAGFMPVNCSKFFSNFFCFPTFESSRRSLFQNFSYFNRYSIVFRFPSNDYKRHTVNNSEIFIPTAHKYTSLFLR